MADTVKQSQIRGIDIDKLVKGFSDEAIILKRFITNAKTGARQFRWYQKTAGFITGPTTTGITETGMANAAHGAYPIVAEQSWVRNNTFVKEFNTESPWLPEADLQDSDVDIITTTVRDLVRGIGNQVDTRISNVLMDNVSGTPFDGTDVDSANAAGTGWDDNTNGDIVGDLTSAKKNIRANSYNPEGATLLINQHEHKMIVDFLINVKGSSIPGFSSELVKDGVVMGLLGLKVVVSSSTPTDNAVIFVKDACTYKQFMPLKSETLKDPRFGRKIFVQEMGEAVLTDPKGVYGITDTRT
jgi:hypothetical protein